MPAKEIAAASTQTAARYGRTGRIERLAPQAARIRTAGMNGSSNRNPELSVVDRSR